jgi:shikimate kinase
LVEEKRSRNFGLFINNQLSGAQKMKKLKLKIQKSNIALIGFMGVGKSAVGKVLSEKLGKNLVEVDSVIVNKAGKTVTQIFQDGEIIFREMEIEAVKEISTGKDQVIACGGGVPLNKINIDRLKLDSVIVWLTATPGVILKRTKSDGGVRPLINNRGIEDIRDLLSYRKPYYQRAADIEVDTSKIAVPEVAEQIIIKLKEYADQNKKK